MFLSLGDSVCTSTTIPLPMMASTESLRALERNAGIWCLLKHNWRQLLNFVPGLSIFNTDNELYALRFLRLLYRMCLHVGLILLCALGNLHVSWTIWKLYMYYYYYEQLDTAVLLAWFVGATCGGMFGCFISGYSKILIYVRKSQKCQSKLQSFSFNYSFLVSVHHSCGTHSSERLFCIPRNVFVRFIADWASLIRTFLWVDIDCADNAHCR